MRTGIAILACAPLALAACWPRALERVDGSGGGCVGCDGGADLSQAQGACGAGCPNGASCLSGVCCAPVSFASTIQPIFNRKCAGCHGSGGETPMSLRTGTAYSQLLAAPSGPKCGPSGVGAGFSSAWRRVAPGDLGDSELWWYMQDCCAPSCGNVCGPRCIPQCSPTVTRCGGDDPLCGQARPSDNERAAVECWILEGAPNN